MDVFVASLRREPDSVFISFHLNLYHEGSPPVPHRISLQFSKAPANPDIEAMELAILAADLLRHQFDVWINLHIMPSETSVSVLIRLLRDKLHDATTEEWQFAHLYLGKQVASVEGMTAMLIPPARKTP